MNGLTTLERVGARVRAARQAKGITQQQLADLIGLTRTSVVNLEAGRQDVGITRMAALAEAFRLDLGDLIRIEDAAVPHKVTIRRAYEVTCETCGGTVIDAPGDRHVALQSKRDHIADHLAAERGEATP